MRTKAESKREQRLAEDIHVQTCSHHRGTCCQKSPSSTSMPPKQSYHVDHGVNCRKSDTQLAAGISPWAEVRLLQHPLQDILD